MRTHLRGKLIGGLLATATLTMLGTVPAHAHAQRAESIQVRSTGGVTETMSFGAVVPRPTYDPDPTATSGPRQCVLDYHEYYPTAGCGGFSVSTVLHNVRSQPGYLNNVPDDTSFVAHADTARTFGCRTAAGAFDWHSAFVVRETQRELTPVYATAQAAFLISDLQSGAPDNGPQFYVNFDPVDFTCPAGETRAQYGLKVSNLSIAIAGSPVFGTHTWSHPGPYYG